MAKNQNCIFTFFGAKIQRKNQTQMSKKFELFVKKKNKN